MKFNLKLIFLIFNILISILNINGNDLGKKCEELKSKYCDFGFILTNPQNGKVRLIYNVDMIYRKKYSPGSLLKVFALLSYAKDNKVNIYETHECKGYTEGEISCWLGAGHGSLDLIKAIAHSCNYYFYYFLKDKLTKKAYYTTLMDFDLYVDPSLLSMNDYDFYITSFGLGVKILVPPVKMIYAYNSIFNGGKLFNDDGDLIRTIDLDNEVVEILRQGMKESYLYGTSKIIYLKTGISDVIAKTGTGANIISGKTDWRKNVGWIIVLAPGFNPTFGMMVVVERSRSSTACSIASELINFLVENKIL